MSNKATSKDFKKLGWNILETPKENYLPVTYTFDSIRDFKLRFNGFGKLSSITSEGNTTHDVCFYGIIYDIEALEVITRAITWGEKPKGNE